MYDDIRKICSKIRELQQHFNGDLYICFHLIQLSALTQMLVKYFEKGIMPTNFQWCLKEEHEFLKDYSL